MSNVCRRLEKCWLWTIKSRSRLRGMRQGRCGRCLRVTTTKQICSVPASSACCPNCLRPSTRTLLCRPWACYRTAAIWWGLFKPTLNISDSLNPCFMVVILSICYSQQVLRDTNVGQKSMSLFSVAGSSRTQLNLLECLWQCKR